MENTKKTVAVIAALLMAAALPCFAKGIVLTEWSGKDESNLQTAYLTFYSDNTWEYRVVDDYHSGAMQNRGTYTGDTTKDGSIPMVDEVGYKIIVQIVGDTVKVEQGQPFFAEQGKRIFVRVE